MAAPASLPPEVEQARASLARLLRGAEGLVGVGVSAGAAGDLELLVLVRSAGCEASRRAPQSHLGCRVQVKVSGQPRKQP